MGFSRNFSPTFEENMNQPIFNNRYILHPDTNKAWSRILFPKITIKRLYRIADNINKYRDDPQIDALPHPKITAHYLINNIPFHSNSG